MDVGLRDKDAHHDYKLYKRRFAVLITVVILIISNTTIWLSYSPVASTVAAFYDVSSSAVNWFSLCFLIMPLPFSFISTFVADKYGLKLAIHIGAALNVLGALIKALGTSGLVDNSHSKFTISLTGQAISAMGQSFLMFISTKLSQTWFPENHRAVTTTFLAMSNPFGLVIAQGVTPFIVKEANDVPTVNYIWFGLAAVSEVVALVCVTRGSPQTPPSRSASKRSENHTSYFLQLKETFTCLPYMLILLTCGCGIGLVSGLATLSQEMLCPLGYNDTVGGGVNVSLVLCGFVGSAIMGIVADKTKKFLEIAKLSFGTAVVFFVFLLEFYLVPDQTAALIIFGGLFGFCGLSALPTMLELAVEAIYPVEETIGTAFVYLSGQIHAVVIVILVPTLAGEQSPERYYLDNCGDSSGDLAKDFTVPLLILLTYTTTVVSIMILLLNTRYKRMEAEVSKQKSISYSNSNAAFSYVEPTIKSNSN